MLVLGIHGPQGMNCKSFNCTTRRQDSELTEPRGVKSEANNLNSFLFFFWPAGCNFTGLTKKSKS